MKSAYELAMERLEKSAPTQKLNEDQKARIAEVNSLYGSRIAEKETFLQGEIVKEKAKGDMAAVAQLQDQLGREVRRLHSDWEEKKAAIHAEKPVTATEEKLARLAATLDEYLAAVPRQREANPPDLMAIFAKLDALEAGMGPEVHPQLRHYLHQKSYRKAHLFLQDRDAENLRGNCGR